MKNWSAPTKTMIFGTMFVIGLWFLYGLNNSRWNFGTNKWEELRDVGKWGQFGDKFGALNTFFTGLALVGIAAGLVYQHREHSAGERATLRAIFDEMEIVWEGYQMLIPALESRTDEGLNLVRPRQRISVFPIFEANASSLGRVEDDSLRRQLLRVFYLHTGMMGLLLSNAVLIDDLEDAADKLISSPSEAREGWRNHKQQLAVQHAVGIADQHQRILKATPQLMTMIEAARKRLG